MQIASEEDNSGDTSMKKMPGTTLYDLQKDPEQLTPIIDPDTEQRMILHMIRLMRENDAPDEQYMRLGLSKLDFENKPEMLGLRG